MKSKEISSFIEFELKGRWPDWEPTQAQKHDIDCWLEKATYEQASKAASQVRSENGYKTPDIGRIAKLCKQMNDEHRTDTKIPCYVVWDDGMLKTFYQQVSGLVTIDDQLAQRLENSLSFYIRNENHFLNHGEFVVFIGEQNYKAAVKLSTENRERVRV